MDVRESSPASVNRATLEQPRQGSSSIPKFDLPSDEVDPSKPSRDEDWHQNVSAMGVESGAEDSAVPPPALAAASKSDRQPDANALVGVSMNDFPPPPLSFGDDEPDAMEAPGRMALPSHTLILPVISGLDGASSEESDWDELI